MVMGVCHHLISGGNGCGVESTDGCDGANSLKSEQKQHKCFVKTLSGTDIYRVPIWPLGPRKRRRLSRTQLFYFIKTANSACRKRLRKQWRSTEVFRLKGLLGDGIMTLSL